MSSVEEIRLKVLAETRAKLREERAAENIAEGGQPEEEKLPPEWAQDVEKSAAALAAVMGGRIVGGAYDPASGSFRGFEIDVNGEHVSLTFNPTDDGDLGVRFLPAVYDSKPVPLTPALQARKDELERQSKKP